MRDVVSCDRPVCQIAFSTTGRYVGVLQNSAVEFQVDTAAVMCWPVPVYKIVHQVPGQVSCSKTATVHENIY